MEIVKAFLELVFLSTINVAWVYYVIGFEQKIHWLKFHKHMDMEMRQFKFRLLIDNINWKAYMDKKFALMKEASEKYFYKWRVEEKIFDEICKGTRPASDLDKLEIMNANKDRQKAVPVISTYPPKEAVMFCRECRQHTRWDFRKGKLVCLNCKKNKATIQNK